MRVLFAIVLLGCSPPQQPAAPSRPMSDLQVVEEKHPEPLDDATDETKQKQAECEYESRSILDGNPCDVDDPMKKHKKH